MILSVLCCLFVFLGMFLGKKFNLKKESICMISGLFLINTVVGVIPSSYNVLYRNYHSSTFLFLILGSILGFLIMKLIGHKYDETDNISIAGFSFLNSYLFIFHRFSILFLIINILYYVLIGIYIREGKSWISVVAGCIIGIIFSYISGWAVGYFLSLIVGFLLFFIFSVYGIVIKNNEKSSYIGLIIGIIVAFLGGIL